MTMPPIDKTFTGTMKDWLMRLTLVERRLAINGGGGGGSTVIQEGTGIDITGDGSSGTPYVVSVDSTVLLPALPDAVRYAPGTTHSVAATAWGTQLPGTAVQSMTVSRATWVLVTFGSWMQSSAGETRAGISLGGATVVSPPNVQQTGLTGSGAWGQTLYLNGSDVSASTTSGQRTMQRAYLLNAGTTTFTIEAYIATAGTHAVNYPVLEIIPLYYDDSPVPVAPTLAALTRRLRATSVSLLTTDQTVDFDTTEFVSGHWSYSTTTKTFTCLVGGQYRVSYSQGFGSVGAGNQDYMVLTLVRNGTAWVEGLGRRDSLGGTTVYAEGTYSFNVGDTISATVRAGQAGGSAVANTFRSWIELVPITVSSGPTITDTGWTDISSVITGGFTLGSGRMQARRIGNQVELRGSITAPSIGAGSGSVDFGTAIPASFRPSTNIAIGTGYTTTAVTAAIVRTDGTLAVGRQVAFSGTFLYTINFMAE